MSSNRLVALLIVASAVAWTSPAVEAKKRTRKDEAAADSVARVGDRPISLDEIDARAKATNLEPYQALYDARRAALEAIVRDELFDLEAEARGMSRGEYVASEVDANLEPLTDQSVRMFYEQNKAQMGGQPFEAMEPRIREFLENQLRNNRLNVLVAELKGKHGVEVRLDAPRIDVEVDDEDPVKGPADAPVRIVEFSDFECPYCSRVVPTIDRILKEYGDRVQVVFRDFPLPFHQQANVAAQAAQCANDQDKFWEYHDKLFANQKALDPESLKAYAADLGMDRASFAQCLDDAVHEDEVNEDHLYGQRLGVRGTPAFFVNGRFLNGAQPYEAFVQIIEEELASATE